MDDPSMSSGFSPIPDPHSLFHSMPPPQSDDDDSAAAAADKSKKGWHRVRWTDAMVTLLISTIHSVETTSAPESNLHKKGKWKTVSRIMLDTGGYSVSPQQCEDKFNDLNKRYKRLNEILGRGTTCRVVENPALLDAMRHLPPKAKEDVRKILASKHLFYREMCSYHNHPRSGGTVECHASVAPDRMFVDVDTDGDDDGYDGDGTVGTFRAEVDAVFQDRNKTRAEQLEWIREREMQLKEERVAIEADGLELEKERFKWHKYRSNKDREMERLRLGNERLLLENERVLMQMQTREVEMEHREATGGFHLERDQGRDPMNLS